MDAQGVSRWFQRDRDGVYTKGLAKIDDREYYEMWQTNSKNPMLFLENTRFLAREECNYIIAQQCAGCSDDELRKEITKNMATGARGAVLGGQLATFHVGRPEIEPYQDELERTCGRAHQQTKVHEKYKSWYLRRLDELPPLALKYCAADARYVLYGFIALALCREHRSTDPEDGTHFCNLLIEVMRAIRKDCQVPFVFHPPGHATLEDLRKLPQHTLLVDTYRVKLEQCLAQTRTVAKAFFAKWKTEGCRRAASANFWTAMRNLLLHWYNQTDLITPNMRGLILLQRRLLWDIWAEWSHVLSGEWSTMISTQLRSGKALRPIVNAGSDQPPMNIHEANDILVHRKSSWDLEEGLRSWTGWQRWYFKLTPKDLGYLEAQPGRPRDVPEIGLLEEARIFQEELAIEPSADASHAVSNILPELDRMTTPQDDLKDTYKAVHDASGVGDIITIPNDYISYERDEVIQYVTSIVKNIRDPEKHALLPGCVAASTEERLRRFVAAFESHGAPESWYLLQLDGVIDQLLDERRINLGDLNNLVDYLLLRLGNYLLLNPHFLWKYIMYPLSQQHSGAGPSIIPVCLSQVMERAHPMVPPPYRLELQRWRLAHFAVPKPGVQAAAGGEGGSYLHPAADSSFALDTANTSMSFPVGRSTYLEMAHQLQKQDSRQCLWSSRHASYGIGPDSKSRPPLFHFMPTFYNPRAKEASWGQVVLDGGLPAFLPVAPDFPTRPDNEQDQPLAGEPRTWTRTEDATQIETDAGPSSAAAPSSASSSSYPTLALRRAGIAPASFTRTIYPTTQDETGYQLTYDEDVLVLGPELDEPMEGLEEDADSGDSDDLDNPYAGY